MEKITFKPKQATKRLLSVLNERVRDVLEQRYGLGKDTKKLTLEAIGKKYGITRERVRQIENHGIGNIRKSDVFEKEQTVFKELESVIDSLGGMVSEQELLEHINKNKSMQNHVYFLLIISGEFKRKKEDDELAYHWYLDEEHTDKVRKALEELYKNISDDDLIPESEIISTLIDKIKDINQRYKNDEIIKRWLSLSKNLDKNPLGEWGLSKSQNVNVKGMRDYAYLAIKKHGSPMHFVEVADAIVEIFNKKAHVATCHNELIKDPRFVLIGRGLYALKEWGYTSGVVRDVIAEILKKEGPLNREKIIDMVKKERYIKDNTIVVNLQDSKCFKRDKSGKYTVA